MASFLALYHGDTVSSAALVAATVDPELVRDFAERMLSVPEVNEQDTVLRELSLSRRRALHLIRDDAEQ